jgi:hypothetical protein
VSGTRGRSTGGASRTATGGRSIRTGSLFFLVVVVGIVALMMALSLVGFVVKPDPAVRAGPMYVTLALITGASLLMLILALNATFLPLMSRRQVPNFQLVMWAMGVTGVVTGLLTLGGAAGPYVTRLVVASLAFAFITIQEARLARAGAATPVRPDDRPAARPQPHPRARQRRGGRKH